MHATAAATELGAGLQTDEDISLIDADALPIRFGSVFRLVRVFFGCGLNSEVLNACSSPQSSTWIAI